MAAVSRNAVPDVLAPDLARRLRRESIPGFHSDAKAAHFANPRNDFWRLLHAAGFTPRLVDPPEQDDVLALQHRDHERRAPGRRRARLTSGRRTSRGAWSGSNGSLTSCAPRAIGFVGKEAYRGPFWGGRPQHGLQEERLAATLLFVLPSTSPANAAVPWDERLHWFLALRELVS